MKLRESLVLFPLLLGPALARAEEPIVPRDVPLTELTLEELVMIDVTAPAKVTQPMREAPSVGAVVPRAQIDSYGWLSLNDVLFRQPGFAPSQDYERVTVSRSTTGSKGSGCWARWSWPRAWSDRWGSGVTGAAEFTGRWIGGRRRWRARKDSDRTGRRSVCACRPERRPGDQCPFISIGH